MPDYISASIMCADALNLKESIKQLEKAGVDYIHIDIMDGAFVPNITLGFDLINSIKKVTSIPLDVHLMVNEPSRFIDRMNLDNNDIICVHYESEIHIHRTLENIRKKGCKTGLAINPQTPVNAIEYLSDYVDMVLVMTVSPGFAGQKMFEGAQRKVKDTRKLLDALNCHNTLIEVDGNISNENGKKLKKCGADIFVLGTSALFIKDTDMKTSADKFRATLNEVDYV